MLFVKGIPNGTAPIVSEEDATRIWAKDGVDDTTCLYVMLEGKAYNINKLIAFWEDAHKEAKDSPEKTCTWTEAYEGNGPWESTCGEAWGLEEGNPKENGMNYCPFCGLHLEMKLYEEAWDETK